MLMILLKLADETLKFYIKLNYLDDEIFGVVINHKHRLRKFTHNPKQPVVLTRLKGLNAAATMGRSSSTNICLTSAT
jgi:hypothetical protein